MNQGANNVGLCAKTKVPAEGLGGWTRERIVSDLLDQIAHFHAQGLGDFHQGAKGNLHVAPLDFADEVMMQIRFFSQFFLGETGLLAAGADGLAHDAAMIGSGRHDLPQKQESGRTSTQYNVFFACVVPAKG